MSHALFNKPLAEGVGGGINFWGNCWVWTSIAREKGKNVVKGGAFDSKRTACRTLRIVHADKP